MPLGTGSDKMYFEYLKEREGKEAYITKEGFFTYKVEEIFILLSDMYVKPEYRGQGVARGFMEVIYEMAKEYEVKMVVSSVDRSTNGSDLSRSMLIKEGFIEQPEVDTQFVYLIKDLKE